jgi:hypothetical protein
MFRELLIVEASSVCGVTNEATVKVPRDLLTNTHTLSLVLNKRQRPTAAEGKSTQRVDIYITQTTIFIISIILLTFLYHHVLCIIMNYHHCH